MFDIGGKDMYKIAICDDDIEFIRELKILILECNANKRKIQFFEFLSGKELLNSELDEIDAVFLDIQMDEMDGNEVSICLKEQGYRGVLIQCSGIFMPTPETIKISPYRYLLKQYSKEMILKELEEIFEELDARKICYEIEGSYKREKMLFRVSDIVYITHHTNGSSVLHLNENKAKKYLEGNIIVSYTFDELIKKLETANFAIPHNSHIVNLSYVSNFDMKREILEVDGKKLSISRGKKEAFFRRLTEYTRKKYKGNII